MNDVADPHIVKTSDVADPHIDEINDVADLILMKSTMLQFL